MMIVKRMIYFDSSGKDLIFPLIQIVRIILLLIVMGLKYVMVNVGIIVVTFVERTI